LLAEVVAAELVGISMVAAVLGVLEQEHSLLRLG